MPTRGARLTMPSAPRPARRSGRHRRPADLQRQFEQAASTIKQIQAQMEADCAATAKAESGDLARYSCDLDQLMFVPNPEKK